MSDLTPNLNVGDIIAGHLEVKSQIGESELGSTYLMSDTQTHETFLVKQLCIDITPDIEAGIRTKVEAISKVYHKSLASVKEFIIANNIGYILMEYIEGETLESHLKSRRERGQILGLKAAYSFLSHLCLGIGTLHRAGFIYGNLSPKTIFVTKEGRVRIANFICTDIARTYLNADAKKSYFNSPFAAPEVKETCAPEKESADVYSLAMLFAELLSGLPLREFDGSPEAFIARIPGISTNVKEALFQATKPELEDRFNDVQTFKDILKNGVDAPADNDISSIVVGVNDLRALNVSSDMPVIEASVRKTDLFDSGTSRAAQRPIHTDVWIYQKDGMDFGPFDRDELLKKFYDDVITESTSIFNTSTKRRQNLGSIPEFEKEIKEYLPIRDHNRAEKAAQERKKQNVKKAAGLGSIAIILGCIAAVIGIPLIILALMPDPEPLAYSEAFPVFEKEFVPPKIEAVALNVDDAKAKALFDPNATEAEREAALKAWEEEHRKKYAGRKPGGSAKAGAPGEYIDTLVFTDEDGVELEPLADWEIEKVCMSTSRLRKVQECYAKYAGGRRPSIKVNFTIQQSGAIRDLSNTASGELSSCINSAFSSMSFRRFGGTIKKVSIPIG